jgi:hypothetical protein
MLRGKIMVLTSYIRKSKKKKIDGLGFLSTG